ncbi:hypothetical protein K458DRAFT_458634 [Lentithecium fluviatile CBS 122367]|uniref:DUF6594 domain-containing protein n=1 Tax=Lentithecium fluviatile CBS 122367 TaxID=1168545 RepID=A0A6G1IR44_9PLEO|nr:hypothetical protein K458DRAFT_458634 [Lentithecium fluviatile CBS 122367]
MEKRLQALEDGYKNRSHDMDNGTVLNDTPERMGLIRERTDLLDKYDSMVLQYSMLASRPSAPNRNIKNVRNWLDNNREAIADEEAGFINRHDLICMNSTAQSTARQIFDHWMLRYTKGFLRCFAKKRKENVDAMNSKHMFISDDATVDRLATTTSFLVGLSVIVIPLWVLWLLKTTRAKLVAVTIFIMIFLVFLLICTVARPLQVLAATAAYSAVLVVFLQPGNTC